MPGRQSPLWPISAGLICGDLFMIILTWFLVLPAVAVPNNRTIDDTFGDFVTGQKVVYTPSTPLTWKTQDCTDCLLNPEVNNAHNGTYTAATCYPALGSMSINLTFTGMTTHLCLPSRMIHISISRFPYRSGDLCFLHPRQQCTVWRGHIDKGQFYSG